MATYNREHYIVEALNTIRKQTYTNWECLIIDDGCTDNTENKIASVLKIDSRFKFLKRPHTHKKGLPGCRNYGLEMAKGDYIIFFDDDDMVHPLNLEICLSALAKNSKASFCNYKKQSFTGTFDYEIDLGLDFNYKETDSTLLEDVVTQVVPFASCTVLWKRNCFEENRFNEDLMYAEEWECYQRILSERIMGIIIDKVLYFNRKHEASNTGQFWSNAPARVNSKKSAIELVTFNLVEKVLLTPRLFKYLVNLAIGFRDLKLVKNVLKISKANRRSRLFITFKYWLFPVWVFYKNKIKKT
ncbi:glycosyltransferase family 2 protein [Seonamhaeicola sp.]|uniref:glycosyltransferase family 2 protein n=1 Tax=Seonamhaeicola sp. TaxID=1912245 RepID=UPI002622E5BE|nr:glycosyltransferase family 2 protein [Seonamhaeicola sp.]